MRAILVGCALLAACESKPTEPKPEPKTTSTTKPPPEPAKPAVTLDPAPPLPATPLGLPELRVPADNPLTPEKVALGKVLFFDTRLSKDGSASCESCHQHDKGWTDGKNLSTKVGGAVNKWHTPTLYNVGYLSTWYWDGRAPTLEKQITAAWKGQMGADPAAVATALNAVPVYAAHFQRAFGGPATGDNISMALASFIRTLRSGDSAWDKYEKGDKTAASADAVEGFKVFTAKAQCALCHAPPLYTDFGFHNIGLSVEKEKGKQEEGRAAQSKDAADTGAFKTPGLRSVSKSGPYFHDGGWATLDDAVALMTAGGVKNPHLDKKLRPVKLSKKEVGQLMAFIQALESTETFEKPPLP